MSRADASGLRPPLTLASLKGRGGNVSGRTAALFCAVFGTALAMFSRCVVAGSAVGSGCVGWLVRESARSASGFVLVASFVLFSVASRWAGRFGPFLCLF